MRGGIGGGSPLSIRNNLFTVRGVTVNGVTSSHNEKSHWKRPRRAESFAQLEAGCGGRWGGLQEGFLLLGVGKGPVLLCGSDQEWHKLPVL